MRDGKELSKILNELDKRKETNKLFSFEPYDWQREYQTAGRTFRQRMLCAGNRTGKTFLAANEVAYHATGLYPEDWEGYVMVDKDRLFWVGSITNESSRDIVQKELFGGVGEEWGTGMIPKDTLIGQPKMRQAGISDVMDVVRVRNEMGGITTIVLKTYEQGWRKWQGTAPNLIWLDEEPDDMKLFSEALLRLITSNGIMLVTFTPLLGETDLVLHFLSDKDGVYFLNASWDDAPHLKEADKAELLQSIPEYERDARTKGIPQLGSGRVFSVTEEDIVVEPFKIPKHWPRIGGVDFGIAHPAAGAWIAWDRDTDTIYIYDCYRKSDETPVYHGYLINQRGKWIPVAWPHDGLIRDKGNGKMLKDQYSEHGVNMMHISARYDNKKGGGQPQEPIILEILERMKTGRLKVFSNCDTWLQEYRSYHRKDGLLVAKRDDVLKASFYAIMMKRFGITEILPVLSPTIMQPILS